MENQADLSRQWITTGAVAGILSNVLFVLLIAVPMPDALEIFVVGLFGLGFSLCGFAIHHTLKYEKPGILSQMGALFIFVSGFLFNLMLVVQQVFRGYMTHFLAQDISTRESEMLTWIRKAVDPIHLSMQLSNDFFYGTAMLLFSVVMYRHSAFGSVWAITGAGIAVSLWVIKCYASPFTPQEIGIPFIVGPLVALWFTAVCVQCLRKRSAILG